MPDNNNFAVVHECAARDDYEFENRTGKCHRPNHVYCFICKTCSNEFHVLKQKYVESFSFDSANDDVHYDNH